MGHKASFLQQSSQLLLPFISLTLAAAIIGLSSDVLAFTHTHRHDRVPTWNGSSSWFAIVATLPYLPEHFTLTRPILLLLTGVFSVLCNIIVVVLLVRKRKVNAAAIGRKPSILRPDAVVIALDALALLLTLAITIYAWHSVHVFPGSNSKSKIGDGPFTDTEHETISQWDPNRTFDPINWNCLIYPYVKGPTRAFNAAAGRELRAEIKRACHEAVALIDLTVPLLIVQCATLCLHYWFWRPNTKSETPGLDTLAKYKGESHRMDDLNDSATNSNGREA